MGDLKTKIEELAGLMTELGLEKAKWSGEGWSVELGTNPPQEANFVSTPAPSSTTSAKPPRAATTPTKSSAPTGTPVSSPMTGIYYSSPSPGAPAFAKVGEQANAGQVVGLIEAMKVFNEITAPITGKVTKVTADNGQLVQPGEPLLYIE